LQTEGAPYGQLNYSLIREQIEQCGRSNARACEDMHRWVIQSTEVVRRSRELIAKVDTLLARPWEVDH